MGKLSKEEFMKRVEATPSVEPDEWDLEMLEAIETENDTSEGITLAEMDALRKCNGRISVRVPKQLHRELVVRAKDNGVSLNQYIVYKLAKG
uniref:Toxin-antitoxin system HicB family antitoxin n=1 Tax=uncultured bacterium contig00017 TaxID=1181508 RepID=A0A806KF29_9BACT|nr:hypothetical protein [uncultured bacterium contig00017]